ncbi:MAG: flagellar basal body P-ring formation chaperone FlgA [Myxococcota bacterium]
MTRTLSTLLLAALLALPVAARAGSGSEDDLRDAFRDAATEHGDLPEDATLSVRDARPADRDLVRDARRIDRVELPPGEEAFGLVTARVHVETADGEEAWTWASARIEVKVPTVVATRDLPRGHVLETGDVTVELRERSRDGLSEADLAVGRVARRAVRADQPLSQRWLRSPRVLSRGDAVDVVVRRSGVVIETSGRALQSGGVGDRVRVEVEATGRVVHGTVRSAHEVEVRG